MFDMATDPYAAGRAKMHIEGNPAKGPADARVTLVEFGDFECPNCRQLEPVLKSLFEKYKLRLIFKDFPLEQLHPWAKTAAIGGRCAFMQSPEAFWKVHDAIYDNQESITPENVWDKLNGFAAQAGLNAEAFKSSAFGPGGGQSRRSQSTRRRRAQCVRYSDGICERASGGGGDRNALQQLIEFELAAQSK